MEKKLTGQNITLFAFGNLRDSGSGGAVVAWKLGEKLNACKRLDRVTIFSKGGLETDFRCDDILPFSKLYSFIKKVFRLTVGKLFDIPHYIYRGIDERVFDFFASRSISSTTEIALFSHPVLPQTLERLKKKGVIPILIALNPHDIFIKKLVLEENKKYSLTELDSYTSEFRLKSIEKCLPYFKYIISYSSVISETYSINGYGEELININYPLVPEYISITGETVKKDNVFRVCYIASSVLLKGLQYLLEAWEGLNINNAELVIGGTWDKNVNKIISDKFLHLNNVKYAGFVEDTSDFYRSASVFVCPSLIDGGPRTVYEAMTFGLPVIVTEGCGAKDIVDDGKEGFIIPQGDPEAIREKIMWFSEHHEELMQMGINAREKIKNYPLAKFSDEIVKVVCKL